MSKTSMGGVIRALFGFALSILVVAGAPAIAQASGVSPSRLRLPKGPGSLEGIGENAEPNVNRALVNYGVGISLPAGFSDATPGLRVSYSSGAGQSTVGMGWSLGLPTIERMTSKGLPRYDTEDTFAADGGSELVRIPGTNTYRARFEGGFSRYTWVNPRGQGRVGWWKVEHGDGSVDFFGASSEGSMVQSALVHGAEGVFRWHLVESVGSLGHAVRYDYVKDGATSLLEQIRWGFAEGRALYRADLVYEPRQDHLSDGKPGFEVRLTKRLREVQVFSAGARLGRHVLSYEGYEFSGGLTRLAGVSRYGRYDDVRPHPVRFSFAYSGTLGGQCQGDAGEVFGPCDPPQVVSMGQIGSDFRTGNVDLIDLNSDALPDLVDTAGGVHVIQFNSMSADGEHRFADAVQSAVATGGSAILSSPHVHMLDVDGDGYSDMVDALNGQILWNRGLGDWTAEEAVGDVSLPDFSADANLSFFDLDGDKRIDVLHSDHDTTWYYRSLGDGRFDGDAVIGESIGAGFQQDGLELADMNGDGLQDAVIRAGDVIAYRLNLGRGRWGEEWVEMFGLAEDLPAESQFIDINGDSLSDLVVVAGAEVLYSLNRNGGSFEELVRIADAEGGGVPERTGDTSIRFADMNGSGSTDIVWITEGAVTYLELFPKRPNLLIRIENGIGMVVEMAYASSVEHMVADGGPDAWTHRPPNPMLVLDRLDTWDTLTGRRQTQHFRYHDGYWDGVDKQFRGYIDVDVTTTGDDSIESGRVVYSYDVGVDDRYHNGLLLSTTTESDGRTLSTTLNSYDDCAVGGIPEGLDPPVRFVCQTGTRRIVQEGAAQAEWITVEQRFEHDGYGNPTLTADLGVVAVGGGACAPCGRDAGVFGEPCGDTCSGDEVFNEVAYVSPDRTGGRWMLHEAHTERRYGRPGAEVFSETRTYYDGDPFEGLPLGELTRGLSTRTSTLAGDGDTWIDASRMAFDHHGNVVEIRDAKGQRRSFEYDAGGMFVLAENIHFDDPDREPYSLRKEAVYDAVLGKAIEASSWMRVVDGEALTPRHPWLYRHDGFGRQVAMAEPGDTLERPTVEYAYEYGDPLTRTIRRSRSQPGGALDLVTVQCSDGLGRTVQTRTRRASGRWDVDGFAEFNVQGEVARDYERYTGVDSTCDHAPPEGSPYGESSYDAIGRLRVFVDWDGGLFDGTPSRVETEFHPHLTVTWDELDRVEGSPGPDTAVRTYFDGLGREVRYEQEVGGGEPPVTVTTRWDEQGNLRGWVDDHGNEKIQLYDRRGVVVQVRDPDTGVTRFAYDEVGNLVEEVAADGAVIRRAYDEANRVIAKWDPGDDAAHISWSYDVADDGCAVERCTDVVGKVASVTYPVGDDGVGVDHFGYNPRGASTYVSRTLDGHRFEFSTEYDNAGRVVATRYPGNRRLRVLHDGAGAVVAVPGLVEEVTYDERGLQAEVLLGNGVRTIRTYDDVSRLSRETVHDRAGRALQDLTYVHDRKGNILSVADGRLTPGGGSLGAQYTYGPLFRLVGARLGVGGGLEETLTYRYDGLDNLLSRTSDRPGSPAHVGDYTYGEGAGPHQVSRAGETSFDYDQAGQVILRGQDALSWDFLGRLEAVRRGATELASFGYGPVGERARKREGGETTYYVSPQYEVRDGISTIYLDMGDARLAKIESVDLAADLLPDLAPLAGPPGLERPDPDRVISSADAWVAQALVTGEMVGDFVGVDLVDDDVDALLAASARRLLVGPTGTTTTWFHADHQGSVTLTSDVAGRVSNRAAYYPFGARRWSSDQWVSDYGYTGKETDRSTGLTDFGARLSDPRVGRWMSADPHFAVLRSQHLEASPSQALNRYAFVGNNPVGYTDPDGLKKKKARATTRRPSPTGMAMAGALGGVWAAMVSGGDPAAIGTAVGAGVVLNVAMSAAFPRPKKGGPTKKMQLKRTARKVMVGGAIKEVIKQAGGGDEHDGDGLSLEAGMGISAAVGLVEKGYSLKKGAKAKKAATKAGKKKGKSETKMAPGAGASEDPRNAFRKKKKKKKRKKKMKPRGARRDNKKKKKRRKKKK